MPRGLQGSEANGDMQTVIQTVRLTEWFLMLHFAGKKGRLKDMQIYPLLNVETIFYPQVRLDIKGRGVLLSFRYIPENVSAYF